MLAQELNSLCYVTVIIPNEKNNQKEKNVFNNDIFSKGEIMQAPCKW